MDDLVKLVELAAKRFALDGGPCHGQIAKKVEKLELDEVLTSVITASWPRVVGGMLGPYRLRSAAQLLNYDQLEVFLPNRELPIGDAVCGDLLNLSIDDPYPVSLFCHEYIWEEAAGHQRFDTHALVADSFAGFLSMVLRNDDLPIDYYAAKTLRE